MQPIPFGESLRDLQKSPAYGTHVEAVVAAMNKLLSEAPINILDDANQVSSHEDVREFVNVWEEIEGKDGVFSKSDLGRDKINQFLPVAALYHDIGKTIQKERHPTVGYYYVTLVEQKTADREDAKQLEELLGKRFHRIMCNMIRYHDLFGVVSTGESSAAVLIDAIPFYTNSVNEQETILSLLLFLNLADIAGTIPLTSQKAGLGTGSDCPTY